VYPQLIEPVSVCVSLGGRVSPCRVAHTPFLRVWVLILIHATTTRSRSKPFRENQLDKAGKPVGIKSLIADFVLSVLLPGMVAPERFCSIFE